MTGAHAEDRVPDGQPRYQVIWCTTAADRDPVQHTVAAATLAGAQRLGQVAISTGATDVRVRDHTGGDVTGKVLAAGRHRLFKATHPDRLLAHMRLRAQGLVG